MADYNKVGLLTLRDGRFLMCRKNHTTSKLILPGGCVEPGESPLDCLNRELREELGDVSVLNPTFLGTYRDRAASDDPSVVKTLEIQLYQGDLLGEPSPRSEIVELVWFGSESGWDSLTPIMIHRILPDLLKRGILPWRISPARFESNSHEES